MGAPAGRASRDGKTRGHDSGHACIVSDADRSQLKTRQFEQFTMQSREVRFDVIKLYDHGAEVLPRSQ